MDPNEIVIVVARPPIIDFFAYYCHYFYQHFKYLMLYLHSIAYYYYNKLNRCIQQTIFCFIVASLTWKFFNVLDSNSIEKTNSNIFIFDSNSYVLFRLTSDRMSICSDDIHPLKIILFHVTGTEKFTLIKSIILQPWACSYIDPELIETNGQDIFGVELNGSTGRLKLKNFVITKL